MTNTMKTRIENRIAMIGLELKEINSQMSKMDKNSQGYKDRAITKVALHAERGRLTASR